MPVVVANAAEFGASLDRFLANTERRIDWAIAMTTEKVCQLIIDETPLDITNPDETVIRGDWVSGIGKEPEDANRGDETGNGAIVQLYEEVRKWKPSKGEVFYFANYREYGEMLEYGLYPPYRGPYEGSGRTTEEGFSTQAPEGMVRVNIEAFEDILAVNARKAEAMK